MPLFQLEANSKYMDMVSPEGLFLGRVGHDMYYPDPGEEDDDDYSYNNGVLTPNEIVNSVPPDFRPMVLMLHDITPVQVFYHQLT